MNESVSKENKKAYEYLYILENKLRELIVEVLTKKSNKQNLSGWTILIQKEIIKKWEKRATEERNNYQIIGSSNLIDYSEFGDIRLIIQKHWDEFSKIFNNQEVIVSKLDELEPIRNNIAHNRKLSPQEFKRLEIYFFDIKKILSKK
jgi:hypothetical protein